MIKDDKLPQTEQHKYCPIHTNTWCKFWQDRLHGTSTYSEGTRLPAVFKTELKYLFDRLTDRIIVETMLEGSDTEPK